MTRPLAPEAAWSRERPHRAGRMPAALALGIALVAPFAGTALAASVAPTFVEGPTNHTCSEFQGDETWMELKVDPPGDGVYAEGGLTVTISGFDGKTFDWSASDGVDAVFVKAGSGGHHLYAYDPEATSDSDLSSPGETGNAISHISFCWDDGGGQQQSTPDVAVTKTAFSATVDVGDAFGFTLTVESFGPDAAEAVALNDTLPLIGGTWTLGGGNATDCAIAAGELTCLFASIPIGETRTVTLSATATAEDCGPVENVVTVTATGDIDPTNNVASASTYVTCADVGVTKTALVDPVDIGGTVGFNVTVGSFGPEASPSVTLTDPLPALSGGWSLAGPDAADCSITAGTLSCAFGTLAPGETRSVHVLGATTAGLASDCGDWTNVAIVVGGLDVDPSNDEASATVHVTCADAHLAKAALAEAVGIGGTAGFNLTVTNDGPDALPTATLTDPLPPASGGWTLGGPDAASCGIADGTLTCTFGPLAPGESRSVHVLGATSAAAPEDCGEWLNVATVVGALDVDATDDSAGDSLHVACSDGRVTKTAIDPVLGIGGTVGFNVTVTNDGPDTSPSVTLEDALPPLSGGWALAGPDAADCSITAGVLSCDFGALAPGESRSVHVLGGTSAASPSDCGDVLNVATVTAGQEIDPTDDEASATAHVTCSDGHLTKTPLAGAVGIGGTVGFNLTATNEGPDAAPTVTLSDTLPALSGGWSLAGPDASACGLVGDALSCSFGPLAPGESRSVHVLGATGAVSDCGDVGNVATLTSDHDVDATDDEASALVHVTCADGHVTKTALASTVDIGGVVGFNVTVTNDGPDASSAVDVSDLLPTLSGGWTLAGPDAAACSITGGTLTCAFGALAPGESRSVHVLGQTTAGTASDCGDWTNVATVVAADDVDASDDEASATVHVTCAEVLVQKWADAPGVEPGQNATFTVNVSSLGPDAATDVMLVDTLPALTAGWTLGGPDAGACALAGLAITCSFGTLAPGEWRILNVTGQTSRAECCVLNNTATVSADLDLDATNNVATASVAVLCACPHTIGYWKTHPEAWPTLALSLGGKSYTQAELLKLLNRQPKGDASLILAHQLIAAKLNVADGAPIGILPSVAAADALLAPYGGKLAYNVKTSSVLGQQMVALSATLDAYNNRLTLNGPCDDG